MILLGPYRYDAGSFVLDGHREPFLLLRRVKTGEPEAMPPRMISTTDSHLESMYGDLFRAWGLRVNSGRPSGRTFPRVLQGVSARVMFHLGQETRRLHPPPPFGMDGYS